MRCTSPIAAWQTSDGAIHFQAPVTRPGAKLQIPCGQCVNCRLRRARDWATRCVHEAQMHEHNEYITLTYDDDHYTPSLIYRDFQLFMKRLRKQRACFDVTTWQYTPRYYMAGEYGELNGRPHFHAALFGVRFSDRQFLKNTSAGYPIYTSKTLEDLWRYGYSSTADVTFESAAYIARYIMKKITGDNAAQHYETINEATGEITTRTPEFNRMSLKPAIGARWIERYQGDVYPHDRVVINGTQFKPPRYYDEYLKLKHQDEHQQIKNNRKEKAKLTKHDNTPERLKAHDDVTKARLNLKKRGLDK